MKTEFKSKFLQHLAAKKKGNEGFTLIELLVVIIIIGILAAIALPAFLNQANKAKQSEAKTNGGSLNRAQQAYYLEKNAFTTSIDLLGLGIPTQSSNYKFISDVDNTVGKVVVSNQAQLVLATAPIKAYVGGVKVGLTQQSGEATTLAVLCEADKPGVASGPTGTEKATYGATGSDLPSCPANYTAIK